MFEKVRKLYEGGMTQVEVARELQTSQKVIWGIFRRNNYKCRLTRKRNQIKENNASWRGEQAGVAAMHYRLKTERGIANHCEVCGGGQYFEWANMSGKYSNIDDYKMMCKSCHAKYDNKIANIKGGDAQ
ncbi:hypothetical protein LCGC14_1574700 [marine sediment metagenome]|uniref:Uncharacterized protein n=1 Tax=marine sediment metagenome TaxID=412755 RepID=A0A0F9KZN8_9ZZZZ